MAENKENPKCENCGVAPEPGKPVNVYNPNTPGHPTKRVAMCPLCAAKEPKATLVSGVEKVPDIAPAVPDDDNVVESKEFGPKTPELIITPKSDVPPTPDAPPEPLKDLGPVPPEVLKQKLAVQEKDHDALVGQRQQLQDKLAQINSVIMVKRGAIAQLRDLLGNAKS